MLTLLSFIFVLGVLIFVHEAGHFIVAKLVGIRVDRFSLGFPPNILARKHGETTYCIGVIPLGGYVKMAGENPDEEVTGAPDEFMSKSKLQRTAVILAGPFMNYVLAILLLIGIYMFTGEPQTDPNHVYVGELTKDGPAMEAGIKVNDEIIAVDGEYVSNFDSLRTRINKVVGAPIDVTWLHDGDTLSAEMTTQISEVPNLKGGVDSVGLIGFTERISGYRRYGVLESISNGFITAHVIVYETGRFVKRLVFGEISTKLIGGPLYIAQQSGKEARKGASSLFFFMALLSINLAVLNVLPIPVLDGGHLVFLAVEAVRGKPLSMKARMISQQVGLVGLLSLILFVTYNDVLRAFGKLF